MKFLKLIFTIFSTYKKDNKDTQYVIYDELSSGENYWGDSSIEEMEKFCVKQRLYHYIIRIKKIKKKDEVNIIK